jgi:hypothetical protein
MNEPITWGDFALWGIALPSLVTLVVWFLREGH